MKKEKEEKVTFVWAIFEEGDWVDAPFLLQAICATEEIACRELKKYGTIQRQAFMKKIKLIQT
jgi:hypothetical protein